MNISARLHKIFCSLSWTGKVAGAIERSLLALALAFALTNQATALNVVFAFTNSSSGQLDTNSFVIWPQGTIRNADGTFNNRGLPFRVQNPTGIVTNHLVAQYYQVTNQFIGNGFFIRVYDSSSNVIFAGDQSIYLGGANPFVELIIETTITNQGGGFSGTATNLDAGATNQVKIFALQVADPSGTASGVFQSISNFVASGFVPNSALANYLLLSTYNAAWGAIPTNIFQYYALLSGLGNGAYGNTNNYYPATGNPSAFVTAAVTNGLATTNFIPANATHATNADSATTAGTATNLLNLQQIWVTNITAHFTTNTLIATGADVANANGAYYLVTGGYPFTATPGATGNPFWTNATGYAILSAGAVDIGNRWGLGQTNEDFTLQNYAYFLDQTNPATYLWSAFGAVIPPVVACATNYTTNIFLAYRSSIGGITFTNTLIYIDPNGNDLIAQVGDALQPFKTFRAAAKVAPDSSAFVFAPGTYDETAGVGDREIPLHNAIVLASGATITFNDPGQIANPIAAYGTLDWIGGKVISKINQCQATISYGYSPLIGTGGIVTNHFLLRDVTMEALTSGGVQNGEPSKWTNVNNLDFSFINCQFTCGCYGIEISGVDSTNVHVYISGTTSIETFNSPAACGINLAGNIGASYISGSSVIVENTNSSSLTSVGILGGGAVDSPGHNSTPLYISGTGIDISRAVAGTVAIRGFTNLVLYGHPYNESEIKNCVIRYDGLTNGAINVMTNAQNQFIGTFTGNGAGLTNLVNSTLLTPGNDISLVQSTAANGQPSYQVNFSGDAASTGIGTLVVTNNETDKGNLSVEGSLYAGSIIATNYFPVTVTSNVVDFALNNPQRNFTTNQSFAFTVLNTASTGLSVVYYLTNSAATNIVPSAPAGFSSSGVPVVTNGGISAVTFTVDSLVFSNMWTTPIR